MPKEIERKFLVDLDLLDLPSTSVYLKQGYFSMSPIVKTVVRIRIKNDEALLTIKGENQGAVRSEYEYSIPLTDAVEMLEEHCQKPYIEKNRYEILFDNHVWEVDIFHAENKGLVVAEIELSSEDEAFEFPAWITTEVTHDARYYNSNLLDNPYTIWTMR